MKKSFLWLGLSLFCISSYGQDRASIYAATIQENELMELLYVYASDYFSGRETGTQGQKIAVDFLKTYYIRQGIAAAEGTEDYFQKMSLDIKGETIDTENVVAIIPGTEKPEEYIIISSHLDHVGTRDGKI